MTPEQANKLIQVLENISNTLADIHTDMIGSTLFEDSMREITSAIRGEK